MAVLSEQNSIELSRKIKRMIQTSDTREQLATTKKYFKLFEGLTSIRGLIGDIEESIKQRDRALFNNGH